MKRLCIVSSFLLVLFVVGCGQDEPTPEPTALLTSTPSPEPVEPEPTALSPTETPDPTEMPQPTEPLEPSPTPLSAESLIEMGDAQLLLSDWRGAEDAYRQAKETEPEHALAYARLAYLLQFHPQTEDEAVEVAREAFEIAPNDPVVAAFLILTLNRVGEYEEALTYAEQIEPLAFNEPFALSIIAELNLSIGNFEEANRLIPVATSLSGFAFGLEKVEIQRIFALHALLNGDRGLSIQYSTRLSESAPNFAPAYLTRAEVLTAGGFREMTQRGLVVEGLILDPDYIPLMAQLARLDAQAGNFELALDGCEDILRLFPELQHGLLCRGNVLLQQTMYEQAGETFNEVIELDDQNYQGYIGRGQANLGLENCETAENDLQTALEIQPYAVQAYVSLGETFACQGNSAEAEAAFQQALALRPFDPATHFGLGNLYLDQNRLDEAAESFLTAVTFSPAGSTPPAYYSNLGQTFQAQSRCNVSGSTPEVTHYLCAGELLLSVDENLKAAEAFNLALDLEENSVVALDGLVFAYTRERLCDVALSFLIQLSDISEPRTELFEFYETTCTTTDPIEDFTPDGDLVSEEEAIRLIETAINEIEGVSDFFVFYDTIDFELSSIGERRVLFVQYFTDFARDSAELNRQLSEIVFAAVEGFVLTDSEPFFMFVQARTSLTEIPAGFIVPRLSSVFWYNEVISTAQFRQTWSSVDDILESLGEEGVTAN